MRTYDKLYIGGEWKKAAGQDLIDVHCSSTEEIIARVSAGTEADADAAAKAARAAFDGWANTPVAERADFLQKISDGLAARKNEIGNIIAQEVGMQVKLATAIQAGLPIASFANFARILREYQFEEKAGNSTIVREPAGVVVAITPWNFPLHQAAAKIAGALAAGCTTILKPSSLAPINAFILAEVIDAVGLPPGVFNLVSGPGARIGETLCLHPDVDMITVTGSTAAGIRIAELAAKGVKRVALELGGKSASVILDDADLSVAVKWTVSSCFLNSGQTCNACTRMLVPASSYLEVAKLAVAEAAKFTLGDPLEDTTKLGPLVSKAQRESVFGFIRKGIEEGAELLAGGPELPEGLAKGWYVKPTIFGRVDPRSTVAQEEIFGPVLAISTYVDEEEAVRLANDSIYGLGGAVFSASDERAARIARRIRTGQVDINGGLFNLQAPFGGFKQSGHGREHGPIGLEEFLEYKALQFKVEKKPASSGS
jgi:acyl-CoA reductase-like NAD-dependent aldehyde dehydrogenase